MPRLRLILEVISDHHFCYKRSLNKVTCTPGYATHVFFFLRLKTIFVVFVWPLAYNGHTDCLTLLLQYSNTENSLDCTDADGR